MLKPQDLLVGCALGVGIPNGYEPLAAGIGLSLSSTHDAVRRLLRAGLVSRARELNVPQFVELIEHGARYVWPLESAGKGRGLPTGSAAPMFRDSDDFPDVGDAPMVWALAGAHPLSVAGIVVQPLYPSAPAAAAANRDLYAALALVDGARVAGNARERAASVRALRAHFARLTARGGPRASA